jgi:hypothetical protein
MEQKITSNEPVSEWSIIKPTVNAEAEFLEILNDFGNPLELLREAISNAIDWGATWISISFTVKPVEGNKRLVIELSDNGEGMAREVLERDFWGLGYSPARSKKNEVGHEDTIGEKGHGTKIYLRSERVIVRTQTNEGAYLSECDRPLSKLSSRQLHEPRLKPIDRFLQYGTGTVITIIGYNDNERSKFVFDTVKDYLLWFTKVGSIERIFKIDKHKEFKVFLKCLDQDEPQEIPFGHIFPEENSDITKLFDKEGVRAADKYVKRYIWRDQRLTNHPEVMFHAVISVEGDEVKRNYNPMIRERRRPNTAQYRVSDRYGIWLCKDFIPVVRVNEWITGFGSGSNAFVLLHGFINCQDLKLTANRGTIANTDPKILEELQTSVQELVNKIDSDLYAEGLYTLREWHEEDRTLQQEKAEFERRIKSLKGRKVARLDNHLLIEPHNESELFGLFITVYTLRPDLFEFEPLDYNTSRGIDIIARNKSENRITEGEHWYVELKHTLSTNFNHAYRHLRWILCWDFDKKITPGSKFEGKEESDTRFLEKESNENESTIYFLHNKKLPTKIQIIRLKEYLKERLDLDFKTQT